MASDSGRAPLGMWVRPGCLGPPPERRSGARSHFPGVEPVLGRKFHSSPRITSHATGLSLLL